MTTRTRFTAYVTKYALTTGILKIVAEDCFDTATGMIVQVEPKTKTGWSTYYHKGDWFATESEAMERAKEKRRKKLASLRKQFDRLEKLEIKVVVPGSKT